MSGYIAAYIVLICLSAFFSASEMCFSSANRMRLESAAEGGSRGARIALKVMDRFDDSLSAILIGNNLVNIATSSIASVVVILIAGDHWTWLSTIVTTILVMIFGETMPKIVAKKNANRIAPEHLEIMTCQPRELLPRVKNAGAVFLGAYSPEPLGDYLAGPDQR